MAKFSPVRSTEVEMDGGPTLIQSETANLDLEDFSEAVVPDEMPLIQEDIRSLIQGKDRRDHIPHGFTMLARILERAVDIRHLKQVKWLIAGRVSFS